MKNRNFFKNSIVTLLPISLGLGLLFGVHFQKSSQQVDASSYSLNSVPTTIDLNDLTESQVRGYYNDLSGLSASERQGTNLLKRLKPILKNGQKYFSYGSSATKAVWQAYEIVDRDWEKSPASAIKGYNSSTNIITGYTYGSSNSSVGSNPYVHALYVNRNVTNETRAWGNHNQDQWGINQEHVWAKSCGFNDESPAVGARGDLMHLWAGNGKVNGTYHSNYYYGYVDKTKSYDNAGSYASTLSGNLKGKSKSKGNSYTVFEPQDSDKGDIARAIFYMAARYNYLSGSDSDGIDAGNPNLEITNELNWGPGTSYTSTTSKKGQMGILQDLLEWNRLDPPDAWEIHRNNLLYNNFTGNRNPFIDFPEWAEYIWGKSTDGSYSSTCTGSANPASDNVNTFSTGGAPTVTNVTISPSSLSLNLKGTTSGQLSATVVGTNNPSQSVSWSSTNTDVATVNSSGVVTAVASGNATIRATSTVDGTKYGSCTVSVSNSSVQVTGVSLNKNSTSLYVGDSETLVETVTPSNATNKQVSWDSSNDSVASVTGGVIHAKSVGSAIITVTTDDQDYTATCSVTIEAAQSNFTASVIIADYASANSWVNETIYETINLDSNLTASITDGGTNTGKYFSSNNDWRFYQSDGGGFTLSLENGYEFDNATFTFTNSNSGILLDSSSNTITSGSSINLKGSSATFTVSRTGTGTNGQIRVTGFSITYHRAKTLESISADSSKAKTNYYVNDLFSSEYLIVTAYYSDETDNEVSGFSVSSPNMSTVGTKTVTVTYQENGVEVTDTYEIEVVSSAGSHSERIVSNVNSSYFETGSIYMTGNSSSASLSCSGFTITQTKETSSYDVVLTNNQIRVYGNQKLMFSPADGYSITSVVLTCYSADYASRIGGNSLISCTKSKADTVVTLTPSTATETFGFKNSYVSYINYIIVNYEESGTPEPSLSWDAPIINVYSGTVTTSSEVSLWNVIYDDGTGSTTLPTVGQLAVKLGGTTISLPHTWSADEDGRELCVEYAGISTTPSTVKVTQTINSVNCPVSTSWDYTFTAKVWSEAGSQTINSKAWTFSGTGNDSTPFFGYESNSPYRGHQFGSSAHYFTNATLSSAAFTSEIDSVTVYTSGASGINATVQVFVDGTSYGNATSITSSNTSYTFDLGGKSGTIEIKWVNTTAKALYIKQIGVNYISGQSNIANSESHINAQRVAVKYAKAFNSAMESTNGCAVNLSSAWSTCQSAYSTFLSEAATLGSNEETYAKNLIKHAIARYSNDSGEACIERMMKTYEVCVQKHGKTAFMSDLITLGSAPSLPGIIISKPNNTVVFLIVLATISVGAIGVFFFTQSRKKEEI